MWPPAVWTFHLNSECVWWWIKLNTHLHFCTPGFSLHTPPCSTLGGNKDVVFKHGNIHIQNSAASSLCTQHELQARSEGTPSSGWILVGDIVPECWAVLSIPESVQSPAWILQSSREKRNSWVSWVIVAQVQLSQMGGVGAQSWGQRTTAVLCDQAARQATHHTHTRTHARTHARTRTRTHTHTHTHFPFLIC